MNRPDNTIPERIVLDVESAWQASWRGKDKDGNPIPVPTGLVRERRDGSYMDKGVLHEFTYHTHTLPEAGPKRLYKSLDLLGDGIVVPIAGRNWRVRFEDSKQDEDDLWGCEGDIPEPGDYRVIFEQTGDDETPFEPWDHDAAVADWKVRCEREITSEREWLHENNTPEHNREGRVLTDDEIEAKVQDYCQTNIRDLKEIEKGTLRLQPRNPLHFFGQPNFIQNEVLPVGPRGECAMHLCTLETEWGDAGNENFLFTVDENGVPCAVWFEASCC